MRAGSEYRNEREDSNAGEIGSEALIEKNGGRGWRVDDQECADPENERNEGERAKHPLGLHAAEPEKRGSFHQPANGEPSAMGFERMAMVRNATAMVRSRERSAVGICRSAGKSGTRSKNR